MLTRIHISNYRSIYKLDLDLSYADKNLIEDYEESDRIHFLEQNKKRFVPCLALYGANASGKTNIVRALSVFRRVVLKGVSKDAFDPNLLNVQQPATLFEISFIYQEKNFTYRVEYNAEEIFFEKLICNHRELFRISPAVRRFDGIAKEEYTAERLEKIYLVEGKGERQEKTFLSVLGERYPGLNTELNGAFDFFRVNMSILGNNAVSPYRGINLLASTVFKSQSDDGIQKAFNRVTEVLKKLDFDISRMELMQEKHALDENIPSDFINLFIESNNNISREKDGKEIVVNKIFSYHKNIEGNEVLFNFEKAESKGTKIISGLLGVLLTALETGRIVAIDELDRSLHPILLVEVVRMFKDKRYNKNNAQLIFTAHDVMLLDEKNLGFSEVGIVRKNLKKGTTVKRLCDEDGLAKDDDIMRFYLDGEFGGRPYPYI